MEMATIAEQKMTITARGTNGPTDELLAIEPGHLRVIRRNGSVTPYEGSKIEVAITKAFLAAEGESAAVSDRIHEQVAEVTEQVSQVFHRRLPSGGTLHIEDIQDQVELALMRSGYHPIARAYVLYREERRKQRAKETPKQLDPDLNVTLKNGKIVPLNIGAIRATVIEACQGLENVSAEDIIHDVKRNLFDGVPIDEINKALTMCARTRVEEEPNYSYVTARLLLDGLRVEALTFLGIDEQHTVKDMAKTYPVYFKAYLAKGIELELLSPELVTFDLEKLGKALKAERDMQFTYLGLQTLYDRYFIHHKDTRYELPQAFFMRVAMGLALNEKNREARAIEFYELLSSFDFMSSTPTLFNSGTLRPQLSSCYLTTVPDSLDMIYSAIRDNALLSKYAGGLGNDWTPVRGIGARIKGTNGKSQGVIALLKSC